MATILKRKPAGVRWARLSELNKRIRVVSPTFNRLPKRIKMLTAWRGTHAVSGGSHVPIRMTGTRAGVRPSSNLPLKEMISFIQKRST